MMRGRTPERSASDRCTREDSFRVRAASPHAAKFPPFGAAPRYLMCLGQDEKASKQTAKKKKKKKKKLCEKTVP
eukprot:NODE_26859_length_535_cov_1.448529.p3 GENE.NODE_26859_length_535_cov_1.448529~~NODE_26859_length_535_cov_1.448529.p3  ORF type:complete len:74 (+),score=14.28 NODE_26859_length_535_cov_1.448529:225-446(+)